jgi:hypothetical protein
MYALIRACGLREKADVLKFLLALAYFIDM